MTSVLELEDRLFVPGVLDQICHHISGDISGHEVLRLRLHDLIIHTWDAAQAIQNTPVEIRPELVAWAVADLTADTFAARHFGLDLQAVGDGLKDQTTLLAAFGRRTSWAT